MLAGRNDLILGFAALGAGVVDGVAILARDLPIMLAGRNDLILGFAALGAGIVDGVAILARDLPIMLAGRDDLILGFAALGAGIVDGAAILPGYLPVVPCGGIGDDHRLTTEGALHFFLAVLGARRRLDLFHQRENVLHFSAIFAGNGVGFRVMG